MTVAGGPTTSPLRQAVLAAITHAAVKATFLDDEGDAGRILSDFLAATSYERASDGDLFDLAAAVGVPEAKLTRLAAAFDAGRIPDRVRLYACVKCVDEGWHDRGDGRWVRCERCNPEEVYVPDVEAAT